MLINWYITFPHVISPGFSSAGHSLPSLVLGVLFVHKMFSKLHDNHTPYTQTTQSSIGTSHLIEGVWDGVRPCIMYSGTPPCGHPWFSHRYYTGFLLKNVAAGRLSHQDGFALWYLALHPKQTLLTCAFGQLISGQIQQAITFLSQPKARTLITATCPVRPPPSHVLIWRACQSSHLAKMARFLSPSGGWSNGAPLYTSCRHLWAIPANLHMPTRTTLGFCHSFLNIKREPGSSPVIA